MAFRHLRHVALISLLTLATQGCGSDAANDGASQNAAGETDAAAPAAAGADPCSLVTKEEVQAATGESILEAKADGDGCTYETDDAMASAVRIEIKRTGGAQEMATAREAAGVLDRMGAGMEGAKGAEGDAGAAMKSGGEAAGIGDEAFFGSNQEIHVLNKDVYFTVSPPTMRSRMSGGNPILSAEQKRAMARAIAEKAAGRL
jgi:hypothetical protein